MNLEIIIAIEAVVIIVLLYKIQHDNLCIIILKLIRADLFSRKIVKQYFAPVVIWNKMKWTVHS